MMRQDFSNTALMSLAMAIALAAGAGCASEEAPTGPAKVRIGSTEWRVELALTPEARELGMGGRTSAPEGTGMLFVHPSPGYYGVWMKDCHVPLDVAFISRNLIVVSIRTMDVEDDPANPRITYQSEHPVSYYLEVPAGAFARANVHIGNHVELLGPARDAIKAAR